MPSKKVIIIVLVCVITAGTLVALIPVFMYGFGVNALSFNMGLGLLGSAQSSSNLHSQDSYEFNDFGSFSTFDIDAEAVKVNPYEYFFRQFEGPVKSEANSIFNLLSQYVDIVIYINISTPTGGFYELTYTLEDLVNFIQQNMNVLLGPNEIQIESGTYEVWVYLVVTITIPDYGIGGYEETFSSGVFNATINVTVE